MKSPEIPFVVEEYIQRLGRSKESVRWKTADAAGRVGIIVIHRGQLWSAHDAWGEGDAALLRLMNSAVSLQAQPLAELDRGPRNVNEPKEMIFLRASFGLDAENVAPRATLCEPPSRHRPVEESSTDPPTLVALSKMPPLVQRGMLPPLPLPPAIPAGHAAVSPPEAPDLPTLASSDSLAGPTSPTTLRPLTVDARPRAEHTPTGELLEGAHMAPPKSDRWRLTWALAAIAAVGLCVSFYTNVRTVPPEQALRGLASGPMPPGAPANESLHSNLVPVVPQATAAAQPRSAVDAARPPNDRQASSEKAARPVVARARAVHSAEPVHGVDLARSVYSSTGQFLRCYDWATERSGRPALGNVRVSVRVGDQGEVLSSEASGAKARGLNACVADVASRLVTLLNLPPTSNSLSWVVTFGQ